MKEASAVEEAPASTGVQLGQQPPGAAAPGAALNSVGAVGQAATHQPAGYTFDPGRFTDVTGSFWKLSSAVDKVRNSDPKAIGHYVFDQVTNAWKQASPTPHAAAKVKV